MIKLLIIPFVFSLLTVYIIRIIKVRMPESYFSLNQIVTPNERDITLAGLIQTFLPHFVGSIILAAILPKNSYELIVFYAFTTSFLIVWPTILYKKELFEYFYYQKKNTLLLIYLLYILSVISVATGGYLVYLLIVNGFMSQVVFFPAVLGFYDVLHPFFQNLFNTLISAAVIALFAKAYKTLTKRMFEKE